MPFDVRERRVSLDLHAHRSVMPEPLHDHVLRVRTKLRLRRAVGLRGRLGRRLIDPLKPLACGLA